MSTRDEHLCKSHYEWILAGSLDLWYGIDPNIKSSSPIAIGDSPWPVSPTLELKPYTYQHYLGPQAIPQAEGSNLLLDL